MSRLFVYGVTAVGKSTWARERSRKLGLTYIDGDQLREDKYIPSEIGFKDTFAKVGTKSAWKFFGSRSPATIKMGLISLRKGINSYVEPLLDRCDDFIFDAAYLDPAVFAEKGDVYLMICEEESSHRQRLFQRDTGLSKERNEARLSDARALQEILVTEAEALGIPIVKL